MSADRMSRRRPRLATADKALAWLLVLSAALHSFGAWSAYRDLLPALFWALVASLVIVLVAALNLLRASRPDDRGLAWVASIAAIAWAVGALLFGALLAGNVADPRALINFAEAAGLAAFGIAQATGHGAATHRLQGAI